MVIEAIILLDTLVIQTIIHLDTLVIQMIIHLDTLVIQMVMARNGDVPVARATRFNGPFQSRRRGLNPIFQTFQSDVSDISIRSPGHNAIWWNPIPKYGRRGHNQEYQLPKRRYSFTTPGQLMAG